MTLRQSATKQYCTAADRHSTRQYSSTRSVYSYGGLYIHTYIHIHTAYISHSCLNLYDQFQFCTGKKEQKNDSTDCQSAYAIYIQMNEYIITTLTQWLAIVRVAIIKLLQTILQLSPKNPIADDRLYFLKPKSITSRAQCEEDKRLLKAKIRYTSFRVRNKLAA